MEQDLKGEERNLFEGVVIDGVDIREGLKKFAPAVYLDVLRSWHKHAPGDLEKLRVLEGGLSDEEGLREYTITVHGAKGSGYGICAEDVGKDAETLEAASRRGDLEFIRANNGPFIEKAFVLHFKLGSFLAAHTETAEKGPVTGSPDTALLARLLEACKLFKSTAMEEILKQLESFEYESGGDLVIWLREQMDNLEYDAIQERLAEELG